MHRARVALWTLALVLGTVMSSRSQSNEQVLHNFTGGTDGADPLADLLFDRASGFLYGTTNNGGGSAACNKGCGTVFRIRPDGSSYSVLYGFAGAPTGDGANPQAGLVIDGAGNLYGTTYNGGAHNLGIVFLLTPIGGGQYSESVIYSFSGRDGSHPLARLVLDGLGNLFGTTYMGGNTNRGIVFQLMPSGPPWKEIVLHSFTGPDGANPRAGVVFDVNGQLWGTAYHGGQSNLGVVFQLGPNGTETFLRSFTGPDGANPRAAVTLDAAGDVFGTTQFGGTPACAFLATGCGVVFELQPNQSAYSVLYSFTGSLDGAAPIDALTLVSDLSGLDLYGTASQAGTVGGVCMQKGCGTAFELCSLNSSCGGPGLWSEYTLFNFNGNTGRLPAAGMVIPNGKVQNDGDLPMGRGSCTSACYGAAAAGGASHNGVLYSLTN